MAEDVIRSFYSSFRNISTLMAASDGTPILCLVILNSSALQCECVPETGQLSYTDRDYALWVV